MMINQGYDGGERLVDNKEEGEVVEKVFMSEKRAFNLQTTKTACNADNFISV